jgi:predicted phosphodiesterase
VRTAIVSDLHLGNGHGEDLLRDAEIRRLLIEELSGADRVVLLGDAIETREVTMPKALEAARPFFLELGEAAAGREVTIVPGNHDHRLAEPLLERLAAAEEPLGLEHLDGTAGEPLAGIATWLGAARPRIAYPGTWLRDDVYATHGHYMDCHMTLPRIECIAAAALLRGFGPLPDPAAPADYERFLRPVYGFSYGLAQSGLAASATRPSERAWRTISGRRRPRGRLRRLARRAAVEAGIPATVWALNRLLRSGFEATLTSEAISRSGIEGATELARRLRLETAHLITGHTHRAGPAPGEPPWELPLGGRLHNTGSWVFASALHHPGTPPGHYWPGTVTWLEDEGPPRRVRLLDDHPRDELAATVRRLRASAR